MNVELNLHKSSEKIFLLGIFLLASTMSIGIVLILIASIISIFCKKNDLLKDKWSIFLIAISFLMLVSCLVQTLNYNNQNLYGWEISLTWIGLLNWLPLFYLFISIQDFLRTSSQRLKVSIYLFSGTIPVLITGLGQYFFKWEGPLILGNGLVIWYLKEIEPHLGLSGLFSNQNYAGTWLSVIWSFNLGFIFINKKNILKKSLSLIFLSIFTLAIILTTSRNAIFGMFLSIPIIIGFKSLISILLIISFLVFLFIFASYLPFSNEILKFINSLFPPQLLNKFQNLNLLNIYEFRRINLWNDAFSIISKRPLFGLGAAFFPILYDVYYNPTNYTERHTHNLFIELTASYGFIVSIFTFGFILYLIFQAWRSIKKSKQKYDDKINKSWLAASIIIVISQMNDITYFDGRISVMFWILLAGLRNIIVE
jgi:O-antigen ligase